MMNKPKFTRELAKTMIILTDEADGTINISVSRDDGKAIFKKNEHGELVPVSPAAGAAMKMAQLFMESQEK